MNEETSKRVAAALRKAVDGFPPQWGVGLDLAQLLVAAFLDEKTPGPLRAYGAMLLSYLALNKFEGYAGGAFTVCANIEKRIHEGATTDELLAEVKQAYENLQDQAHALYKSMYAGGLSYYDAINQNMAIGTPSEELAKLLSDYSAEVLVTLTKQPSDDAEPFQDEPAA